MCPRGVLEDLLLKVVDVFPHCTIEVEDEQDGHCFKVNGRILKRYRAAKVIPPLCVVDLSNPLSVGE